MPVVLASAFKLIGPIFFGGFILLTVFGILFAWIREKKRTETWQRVAETLGFDFLDKDECELARDVAEFKLFQQGHARKSSNAILGETAGIAVLLFDYKYTTGSGKNSSTHSQTVCVLRNEALDLPHFFVRRQSTIFDFLGKMFGGQDIDFDEDADFSKRFVLQGDDEAAVRRLFGPAVRENFLPLASTNPQIEGCGRNLLLHHGKRTDPKKAEELIAQAFELMQVLVAAQA